jgi:hypothetical protein
LNSLPEAARYLRMPLATLRSWVQGRHYPTGSGQKFFEPVMTLPDPKLPSLSFFNLVEAHVLDAIRRKHDIHLDKVRAALSYVKKQFGLAHPLAEKSFRTDGISLFVSHVGSLIDVSKAGQLAMGEAVDDPHLRWLQTNP